MAKRVAVVTDATSAGYFFPHWHRYYAGQFGATALHVVAYRGIRDRFASFELGSLIERRDTFDDERRATHISHYVAALLENHDVVIRCDVDEFLVPAPTRASSLRDYVESLDRPYVTAIGLDLVEARGDSQLQLDNLLLPQRPWCVETTSLNKTSIVTRATDKIGWAPGFHAATVKPLFHDLFLLHLKFADVKGRVLWFSQMLAELEPGSSTYDYYNEGRSKVESFAAHLNRLPRNEKSDIITNSLFREQFLNTVTRNVASGIWQGDFIVDRRLLRHGLCDIF